MLSFPGGTRTTGSHDGVSESAKLNVMVTAAGTRVEVQVGETEDDEDTLRSRECVRRILGAGRSGGASSGGLRSPS